MADWGNLVEIALFLSLACELSEIQLYSFGSPAAAARSLSRSLVFFACPSGVRSSWVVVAAQPRKINCLKICCVDWP